MSSSDVIHSLIGVEGWLTDHEALLLYRLAEMASANGEIVEIGSWKGKSTICLGSGLRHSHKAGKVWAVDPHQGIIATEKKKHYPQTYTEFLKNIAQGGVKELVIPIRKTSVAAVKSWRKPIRLLFIDGLHDYEHAKEDYLAWSPHVTINGIIAFHDGFCGEKGVWQVIHQQVLSRQDLVDIGTVSSVFYVMIGKPSFFDILRVGIKKNVVLLSNSIHRMAIPWKLKSLLIHHILRLFLITRYTLAVYTQD